MLQISKFNRLTGDLVLNTDNQYLQSFFKKHKISELSQRSALMPSVFKEELFGVDVVILDPFHWYYPDHIFIDYVHEITAQCTDCILCLGDFLWTYNYPSLYYSPRLFIKELSKRTKLVADIVHKNNSKIKILSPTLEIFPEEQRPFVLDYFRSNHQHFDFYSVICEFDFTKEKEIAKLSSLINDIQKFNFKPLWIIRFAMPTAESAITSAVVGKDPLVLMSPKMAARKMQEFFSLLDNLSNKQSKWFLSGVGKDSFSAGKTPSESCYWLNFPHHIDDWENRHFCGLINYRDQIKLDLMNPLLSLIIL